MFLGLALTVVVLFAPACESIADEEDGQVPSSEIPLERQGTMDVRVGYTEGKVTELYNFGKFVPGSASWFPSYSEFPGMPVGEMYVMADSAGALSLEGGQAPIIDTLPRQAQYTDFFELVKFAPDGSYTPGDIKSRATLLRSGFALTHTGLVVNCPVVGEQTALAPPRGTPLTTLRKIKVWYRKKEASCILAEGGAALFSGGGPALTVYAAKVTAARTEYRVPAAEVYTLVTTAFSGADLVSSIGVPNNDIFRYAGGNAKASPLSEVWEVTVPSDYKVGSRTSYKELFPVEGFTDPAIAERVPAEFWNCSVISVGTAGGTK